MVGPDPGLEATNLASRAVEDFCSLVILLAFPISALHVVGWPFTRRISGLKGAWLRKIVTLGAEMGEREERGKRQEVGDGGNGMPLALATSQPLEMACLLAKDLSVGLFCFLSEKANRQKFFDEIVHQNVKMSVR